MRVSWRQPQPRDPGTLAPDAPDDQKYDFSVIDDTLAQLAGRGMRLMLRVHAYNSCRDTYYPDDTNIAIPDWVRALPGASTDYAGPALTSTSQTTPPTGSSAPRITQVVPNWSNPNYLAAFEQLLAALGRRYDRDERFSVFEFSGFGDFSEDHNAYLRDVLGAPGPAPEDSVALWDITARSVPRTSRRVHSAAGRRACQRVPPHPTGGQPAQPGNPA